MERGPWGQAAEVCALANDLTSLVHSFHICKDGDDDSSMALRGCLLGPHDIKKNEKAQSSLNREKWFWNSLLFGANSDGCRARPVMCGLVGSGQAGGSVRGATRRRCWGDTRREKGGRRDDSGGRAQHLYAL